MVKDIPYHLRVKAQFIYWAMEQSAFNSLRDDVIYPESDIPNTVSEYVANLDETKTILWHFQAEGAIEIIYEYRTGKRQDIPYKWAIRILKPQFYKLDDSIKELLKSKDPGISSLFTKPDSEIKDFSPYFGFTDKTFFIKRISKDQAAINFNLKKGEGDDPYFLMRAFVNELYKNGKLEDGHVKVIAKRNDIMAHIKKNWPGVDIDRENWLRYTKGNLIKKIPRDYKDEELIVIDHFDGKSGGYPITIKLPF